MGATISHTQLDIGHRPFAISELDQVEAQFEAREPSVLAFMPEAGRFDRLRREARALLERFPDAATRPPLFGVLVGVKDIFHVDGFPTTGGSRLPPTALAGAEAESVTLLKKAGTLILGKTVSTEFAYFAPGPTRNPHNPDHTPGGSSSGSAAAVGAGLCPLALGTQTIGSITRPAAFCGVVGYKPSYDRISRAGVIPLSPSLDHVGVFTAQVADAARAASVLCNDWKLEGGSWRVESGGRRPVLGVPEGAYLDCATEEGFAHFRSVYERLALAGYEIKPIRAMNDYAEIRERHYLIVAAEAARVHAEWFARYGELYHPKTADLIRRGQSIVDAALAEALRGREKLRSELTALMDQHGIDLWIAPAAPGAAPRGLDSTGDPVMNLPWTHSGLPTLTLPSGVNAAGLPLGLQLAGRWYADEALLAWANEIARVVG
jgi:Asp-tRNA(Asn)/Glu-tRNA(Gln) amidotransferase A subunit family amidase